MASVLASALALSRLKLKKAKSMVPKNSKKTMMKMLKFSLTTLGRNMYMYIRG